MQGPHCFLLCMVHLITALMDEEKKTIVEKHNFYRSRADPPAADMKSLRWDKTLEDMATSYAAKCIWEHNEERGFRGENLFMMSGSSLDVDLGVDDWYRERDYYNFTTDICQEGKMCGHYTQMVWADTERVGCGEKFCEKVEGFEEPNMFLLVCNYEPPGNFLGEKPYKPGDPCSSCPSSHICRESLCIDETLKQEESSTAQPGTTLFIPGVTHPWQDQERTQSELVPKSPQPELLSPEPSQSELTPEPSQSELTPEPSQSEMTPEPKQSELTPEPSQSELIPGPSQSELTPEPKQSALTPEPTQSELTPEPTQSELTPEPSQSELTPEPSQSELTPEPSQSELTPEPSQSELTPEPKQSELTPEPSQSELIPGPSQSELTPEPSQLELTPEPKQSALTPEPTQSELTPEPTQSELTPEPSQSELTPEPSQSVLTPEPSQSELTPEPSQSELTPEPKQSELTPEPSQSELTPEPSQSEMTSEPTQSKLTPEPIQSVLTPEPIQSEATPSSTKSEMASKATWSELDPQETSLKVSPKPTPLELLVSTQINTEALEVSTPQGKENPSPALIGQKPIQPTSQVTALPSQEYLSVSVKLPFPMDTITDIDKNSIDKAFSNDQPDAPTEKEAVIPVTVSMIPTKPARTQDISVLVSKPTKKVDDTVISQDQARRKDTVQRPPKTFQDKEKKKNMNLSSFKWKKPLSSSMRWDYKSGFSERTYFGRPVHTPHFVQAPKPCAYPCLRSQSTSPMVFPLYRTNHISPLGGYAKESQWVSKPQIKSSFKQLCKLLGYKRGVYSLYLPKAQQH